MFMLKNKNMFNDKLLFVVFLKVIKNCEDEYWSSEGSGSFEWKFYIFNTGKAKIKCYFMNSIKGYESNQFKHAVQQWQF